MHAWNAGYITEIPYTHGYYRELNPLWLKLVMAYAGYAFPDTGTACELGFGQGVSLNIHATASEWQWHGTDFNPAQVAFARELARQAGHRAALHDDTFEEFVRRTDLPDFDFIALHGIWSWISDDNRHAIIDFIRHKLKVGGVVYVSYNAMPGWAPLVPLRHVLSVHAQRNGGPLLQRARQSLDFCERLLATDPLYLRLVPLLSERLQNMREHPMEYLLHEYFNHEWSPMPFSQVADWMARAKLDYACSADPLNRIEALNTTAEQQALLAELGDPVLRQDVRDLMIGCSFRKDCWIKGARLLTKDEQDTLIDAQYVILSTPRDDITPTIRGAAREGTMMDSINQPLLDLLQHHEALPIGELQARLLPQDITKAQVREALMVLAGVGHLTPTRENIASQTLRQASALNRHILARPGDELQYLASPVTGSGVALDRINRLMLLAAETSTEPEDWVQATWQQLSHYGQRLLKDGEAIENEQDNLAELRLLARNFQQRRLPLLRALRLL